MSLRIWLKLATTLLVAIFVIAIFEAWRAERRDTAQLEAELAATKQALSAADARQHDRDTQLAQTLSSLAAEKARRNDAHPNPARLAKRNFPAISASAAAGRSLGIGATIQAS